MDFYRVSYQLIIHLLLLVGIVLIICSYFRPGMDVDVSKIQATGSSSSSPGSSLVSSLKEL